MLGPIRSLSDWRDRPSVFPDLAVNKTCATGKEEGGAMYLLLAVLVLCLGTVGVLVIRRVGSENFPHGRAYWRVLAKCSAAAAVVGLLSSLA